MNKTKVRVSYEIEIEYKENGLKTAIDLILSKHNDSQMGSFSGTYSYKVKPNTARIDAMHIFQPQMDVQIISYPTPERLAEVIKELENFPKVS